MPLRAPPYDPTDLGPAMPKWRRNLLHTIRLSTVTWTLKYKLLERRHRRRLAIRRRRRRLRVFRTPTDVAVLFMDRRLPPIPTSIWAS